MSNIPGGCFTRRGVVITGRFTKGCDCAGIKDDGFPHAEMAGKDILVEGIECQQRCPESDRIVDNAESIWSVFQHLSSQIF